MTTFSESSALTVCLALAACGPNTPSTTTPTQAAAPPPAAPTEAVAGTAAVTTNAATMPDVGQPVPAFTLPDADGQSVSLEGLLASGPAVVVFYRGDWWPHCRKQLVQLQDKSAQFAAKGAQIVAIVVDGTPNNKALSTKLGVEFPILSDPSLATIRAYGIEHVGEAISLPATFIIGADGKLVLRYVGDSPPDRPDIDNLLKAL